MKIKSFMLIIFIGIFSLFADLNSSQDNNELIDKYLLSAYKYEREGKWGNSLVEYLKAREISGNRFLQEIKNSIKKIQETNSIKCGIYIPQILMTSSITDQLSIFLTEIYSNFFTKTDNTVLIIEKQRLKEILDSHKVFLSNNMDFDLSKLNNLKEINFFIVIKNFTISKVDKEKNEEKKSKEFIFQEEKKLNSNWIDADEELKRLRNLESIEQSKLNQAKLNNNNIAVLAIFTKLLSLQADLINAKSRRNRIEKYNEIITKKNWVYTIVQIKKSSEINLEFTIMSLNPLKKMLNRKVKRKISFNDSFTDNPNPKIRIPVDLLNIPSNENLQYHLLSIIAHELTIRWFKFIKNNLIYSFYLNAEHNVSNEIIEDAIEEFASFLVFSNKSWSNKHIIASKYILDHKGLEWKEKMISTLNQPGEIKNE